MDPVVSSRLILGHNECFGLNPPQNRLSILAGISKKSLIAEFSGLNYRLKPKESNYYDYSLSTQIQELKRFCAIDVNLYRKYACAFHSFTTDRNNYPLIFTRQTCIYALEELVQSDLEDIEDFDMARTEVWSSIMRYIVSINTTITNINKKGGDSKLNVAGSINIY